MNANSEIPLVREVELVSPLERGEETLPSSVEADVFVLRLLDVSGFGDLTDLMCW